MEFPRTHSIREILNLVKTVDEDLANDLLLASALTPYGVEVRYPGDIPEPTQQETEEALSLAKKVQEAVLSRLKEIRNQAS